MCVLCWISVTCIYLTAPFRFDVDVPGGPTLMESRGTAPGAQLCAVPSPVGMLGVTVCYDLRFPELYQTLRFDEGAEVSASQVFGVAGQKTALQAPCQG